MNGRARLAGQEGKGCKEAEGQRAQTAEVRKGRAELPLPSFPPGALCGPSTGGQGYGARRHQTVCARDRSSASPFAVSPRVRLRVRQRRVAVLPRVRAFPKGL